MSETSVRSQYMTPEYSLADGTISALYYHLPFCKSRCTYCDFTTAAVPKDDPQMQKYVDALTIATKRLSRAQLLGQLGSIYLGGGTPTFMGSSLVSLVYGITLLVTVDNVKEFTVECNPESFTEEIYKDLWALGVNRYSLGVQSFVDEELATINRAHTVQDVYNALDILKMRDGRISIDLMCGLPGQTIESFTYSLNQAINLGIPHLSIYPLTVEEGTPLARQIAAGEVGPIDEDLEADAMEIAARVLGEHGYHRYEVASYCLEGEESIHNQAYWTGKNYVGLGVSAASMLNKPLFEKVARALPLELAPIEGFESQTISSVLESKPDPYRLRFEMIQDTAAFTEVFLPSGPTKLTAPKKPALIALEAMSVEEAVAEDLMLGFRLSRGVSEKTVADLLKKAPSLAGKTQDVLAECERLGLIGHQDGVYKPTTKGWLLGNELFGRVWDIAEER